MAERYNFSRPVPKDSSIFELGKAGFERAIQFYNKPSIADLRKSYQFVSLLSSGGAGGGAAIALYLTPHLKESFMRGDIENTVGIGIMMGASVAISTSFTYILNGTFEAWMILNQRIQRANT